MPFSRASVHVAVQEFSRQASNFRDLRMTHILRNGRFSPKSALSVGYRHRSMNPRWPIGTSHKWVNCSEVS